MNIQSVKRNSSATLVFQVACFFGLTISALVSALDVCKSNECHHLAATIQSNIDPSVDPCQDYFQYACGNFIKNHPTPDHRATYSTITDYSIQLKEKLYNLLEEPESPSDSSSAKAAKKQYQICKNEVAVEAAGLTTLLDVINGNGGWPMIVPDVFPYRKMVLEVQDEYNRLTGNGPLYTFLIHSRTPDSSDNAIILDQPTKFPGKNYNASNPANAAKFIKYITDVASEFVKASGVTIPLDRLHKDAQDILDFHVKLLKLKNPNRPQRRGRGVGMKVSEAQVAIQNGTSTPFNLLTSLQRLYSHVLGVTVTKDEVINVRELVYMQGLVKLLLKTSPVTVLNYIHFHFVEPYLPLTTKAVRKLVDEVYDSQPVNRTMQCATQPNIHTALSRMFIKKYVPASKKLAGESIVNDLKAQVKLQIERSLFIDAETQPKALAKLNNLYSVVAYSNHFDSDEKVDQVYAKYQMGDDVVENILHYYEVKYAKHLESLRVPINHTELRLDYEMSPILEGTFYSLRFNRLGLPSRMLEVPLFSENYPAMSNLAGFGQAVGARLADMYTFLGTQFDDQGNLVPWTLPTASEEFEAREQCFIDQYSDSVIKELADAGLHFNTSDISYRAILARYHFALKTTYEAHQANMKPLVHRANYGTRIESLPMSEPIEKQFFLNFANVHCHSANPVKLLKKLKEDSPHTPTGRIKVNSAVANFPEFSLAYGCPSGTPMNPVKKCTTFD